MSDKLERAKTVKRVVTEPKNYTLNASGYLDITPDVPSEVSYFRWGQLYFWQSTTPSGPISIVIGGNVYLMGAPNTVITGLRIAYYYVE